ncbi:MAG: DNA polymerase III subunit delta [Mediterranea sp.]|jgi:DNA polymerase-3 subunit delta'|nr:DNA polymerase III subunit delta [Mediterranea sp.]
MLFKDIIGQEVIKQHLIQEVKEGRVAHAQLFCGAPGVGKLPLALAYARYLCCVRPTDTDACGTCPSCIKWNKLVHPDVHFVFPIVKKGNAAVCDDYIATWRRLLLASPYFAYNQWLDALDAGTSQAYIFAKESDEISRKLSLKSSEGGYKICIIYLPEKMYKDNVFGNKLLKLLEEPPSKTLFLLVSENPDAILTTILSRTQRINIPKLEEHEIADALQQRYGVQPADSHILAHLSNGSFVKALEEIHLNEDNEIFFELFTSLMRLSYARKIREMKQWSEQLAGMGREKQKNFLEYAQRMIRENFIYNFHRKQMNYLTVQEENFSTRFAPFINERNVMEMMHELSEAQAHIEQNVNAKMVFFDFALKMIVLLKT